jgi:hypothetical protein
VADTAAGTPELAAAVADTAAVATVAMVATMAVEVAGALASGGAAAGEVATATMTDIGAGGTAIGTGALIIRPRCSPAPRQGLIEVVGVRRTFTSNLTLFRG